MPSRFLCFSYHLLMIFFWKTLFALDMMHNILAVSEAYFKWFLHDSRDACNSPDTVVFKICRPWCERWPTLWVTRISCSKHYMDVAAMCVVWLPGNGRCLAACCCNLWYTYTHFGKLWYALRNYDLCKLKSNFYIFYSAFNFYAAVYYESYSSVFSYGLQPENTLG